MKSIKFSLLTNEEKQSISVIDINNENDLNSPLMGTTSDKKMCVTCGKRATCSGHCGLIQLPYKMANPLFEKSILNYINSHCHNCGKPLLHKRPKVECQSCKHITTTNYKFEEGCSSMKPKLNADDIVKILTKINPALECLMIDSVIVPPSRIRVTAPEYPQSTELSKMYVRLLRSKNNLKHEHVKAIMGSQRNSGLYRLISGKEGLFRQNIFGKRVNRSARTIVVGDPFLPIECVRLPEEMMDVLRPEIRITFYNAPAVRTMAAKGEIRFQDNELVQPHQILPGNTFFRLCQENDMVCINRQPSLSKYSFMSFGVKKSKSKVMMINPCVTTAFNADFDGDEMNVFLLDDVESRFEVQELLNIKNNSEFPAIQPVQDTITGSYLMSKGMHADDFDNYYMYSETTFEHFKRCKDTRSSRGILSLAFPSDFNLELSGLVIKQGILEAGILTKKMILNIMTHLDDRCRFLNVLQKITSIWLMGNGLSISLTEYKTKINFESLENEINNSSYSENEIKQSIDIFRADQERIWFSELEYETNLSDIVMSGAKGQPLNMMQMCCYLGQQYVGGERIGFIKSSYMEGLNPTEYFFHQMAAREGVVNTGVSTSETGYLGRRATKIISDTVTDYDNLVVEHNRIISF